MKSVKFVVSDNSPLLDTLLRDAGIDHAVKSKLTPHPYQPSTNVTVAVGDKVAQKLIPNWPKGSILERRGYIFKGYHNEKVIPIVDMSTINTSWVPWRIITQVDMTRIKKESAEPHIVRPMRKVKVIASISEAEQELATFKIYNELSCDIELTDSGKSLGCIGFSAHSGMGVVFIKAALSPVLDFLATSDIPLIFCNGQFDLHFLYTRVGVKVKSFAHDIQLAWHAMYPELAGSSDTKNKYTRKALSFLASIYTNDEWWKDYNFTDELDKYKLNAIDVCATLDIMHKLRAMQHFHHIEPTYQRELAMVWPVVMMQARGLKIDEDLRKKRLRQLSRERKKHEKVIESIAIPLIEDAITNNKVDPKLFTETDTCSCCRNGKVKSQECWSCAGFSTKPTKKQLDSTILTPCTQCGGQGQTTKIVFKPRSSKQKIILLYDILGFKVRRNRGSVSVDEHKLRDMLMETV